MKKEISWMLFTGFVFMLQVCYAAHKAALKEYEWTIAFGVASIFTFIVFMKWERKWNKSRGK